MSDRSDDGKFSYPKAKQAKGPNLCMKAKQNKNCLEGSPHGDDNCPQGQCGPHGDDIQASASLHCLVSYVPPLTVLGP